MKWINVLVKLYNSKLAALTNQNVLLEAKLTTLSQDFREKYEELKQENAELKSKLGSPGSNMAKPSTRQGLIDYCLRQLGAPVLEINVDDDQIDDLVDDAIQYFNERHYDGVEKMYLKYKITQDDVDRGHKSRIKYSCPKAGIVTTTATSTSIVDTATTSSFYETSNFIQVPDSVIGVEKIFKFDTSSISGGMFSIKYQLFLNDLYYFNSVELLQYAMTKSYLEDIDFLLTPDKQIRFNKRQDRLYLILIGVLKR